MRNILPIATLLFTMSFVTNVISFGGGSRSISSRWVTGKIELSNKSGESVYVRFYDKHDKMGANGQIDNGEKSVMKFSMHDQPEYMIVGKDEADMSKKFNVFNLSDQSGKAVLEIRSGIRVFDLTEATHVPGGPAGKELVAQHGGHAKGDDALKHENERLKKELKEAHDRIKKLEDMIKRLTA